MKPYDRKGKVNSLARILWYAIVHDIDLPRYEYTESQVEHYNRCVREGYAAYVISPPIIPGKKIYG